MENLRKILGYVFFGVVLAAAAIGVIIYITDIVDVFKSVNSFDAFLMLAGSYLARIVCWTIIAILGVFALIKCAKYDAKARDDKGVTFILIAAIAELIGMVCYIMLYAKNNAFGQIPGKIWALTVIMIMVIVAVIVRKAAFAQNVLVGKIMAAALALVMFVVMIVLMDGVQGKYLVTYILWMLAYGGLVAAPLLSSPLK